MYPFVSSGRSLYVSFQSGFDGALGVGFNATFESVTLSNCSGTTTVSAAGASFGVEGAGVADSVYRINSSCSWIVAPPPPVGLTALDVWHTVLTVRLSLLLPTPR
jgi:hypothetical protein